MSSPLSSRGRRGGAAGTDCRMVPRSAVDDLPGPKRLQTAFVDWSYLDLIVLHEKPIRRKRHEEPTSDARRVHLRQTPGQ